jgi:hypothetical protein
VSVLGLTGPAVGKLLAIHDRTEAWDAVDLWALDYAGVDLERIRRLALDKDAGLAAAALQAIDSLDRLRAPCASFPWPEILIAMTIDDLKGFLDQLIETCLQNIRSSIGT